MKIKMFIPIALTLCLAFTLCACGTTTNTNETTTAPATTTAAATEATTTAPATTVATTTAAATEAQVDETTADFTEEDALELVKNTYEFSDEYYFVSNGTVEVEGTSYYAVDLRRNLEVNTTYISSYFVTLDGSEIHTGFIAGGVATISDETPTIDVTEDNAVKVVEAAYDFEEGCFLKLRGTEEIEGTTYFAVDLMKSNEANTTYLSSFFVTEGGQIVKGYYAGGVAYLAE